MTSEENKQAYKTRILGGVSQMCTQTTAHKGRIDYNDGKGIVSKIEMINTRFLGYCPWQIDAANKLALTFIAPSLTEKIKLLRHVLSVVAGMGGIVVILSGIGMAAGWGVGTLAAIKAWFIGTSMMGPIGMMIGGTTLATLAAYFYFGSNDAKTAEKFENCLVNGLDKAIDQIWPEKGESISEKLVELNVL